MRGAARMDQYFHPDIELMPRTELEALQLERLVGVLAAATSSPLHAQTWRAAGERPDHVPPLGDFVTNMPCISKDDIRRFRDEHADPYGGLLCVPPSELTSLGCTSGTTGEPTFIPERFDTWAPYTVDAARAWW